MLTKQNKKVPKRGGLLTKDNQVKFKISLERSLKNRFCFKDLGKRENREFSNFINKTVGRNLTFDEVESLHGTKPDKNDKIDGLNIIHFKVTRKFRIHGYIKSGYFVLCRIDPNHKVH